MNNYLDNIDDKEQFTQTVKDALSAAAYSSLENMKHQMANDFLKNEEDE